MTLRIERKETDLKAIQRVMTNSLSPSLDIEGEGKGRVENTSQVLDLGDKGA